MPIINGKAQAKLDALSRPQGLIHYGPDGRILSANESILATLGYQPADIVGQDHSVLVDAAERNAAGYQILWNELRKGVSQTGEVRRLTKGGRDVWLEGSYVPVFGRGKRVDGFLQIATDVSDRRRATAEMQGQLAAIYKAQAVIHFQLDGTIIKANENFLSTVGYDLPEIQGRHHQMFVDPAERATPEYRQFWEALAQGRYQSGVYKRSGKGGREIWLQATYNPILDTDGRPLTVVKFATDITESVRARLNREGVQNSMASGFEAISVAIAGVSGQAAGAAGASAETSQNVRDVARGAEELAASVSEIARQVDQASAIAGEAVQRAGHTNGIMSGLSEAAQKIGAVVELINSIAGQTNLLALNATIEAARAGEAGKGFAVVAAEVKSLASQTSNATSEISSQVAAVQAATREAVDAIAVISGIIGQINGISGGIAAAVEEQSAVARTISVGMQTAASGVETMTRSVNAIASAANDADAANQRIREAARKIA